MICSQVYLLNAIFLCVQMKFYIKCMMGLKTIGAGQLTKCDSLPEQTKTSGNKPHSLFTQAILFLSVSLDRHYLYTDITYPVDHLQIAYMET